MRVCLGLQPQLWDPVDKRSASALVASWIRSVLVSGSLGVYNKIPLSFHIAALHEK